LTAEHRTVWKLLQRMKSAVGTSTNGRNHRCFTKYFDRLVTQAGGKWVVIAAGQIIKIGPKQSLKRMVKQAKARYPNETPLVAPIPTDQDLQCIL